MKIIVVWLESFRNMPKLTALAHTRGTI